MAALIPATPPATPYDLRRRRRRGVQTPSPSPSPSPSSLSAKRHCGRRVETRTLSNSIVADTAATTVASTPVNICRVLMRRSTDCTYSRRRGMDRWANARLAETATRNERIDANDDDTVATRRSTAAIAISPNGDEMASTHGDHSLRIYAVNHSALTLRHVLRGHMRTAWCVAYHPHPQANRIVSACLSGQVRVWDTRTGDLVAATQLSFGPSYQTVDSAIFHPNLDGDLVLVACNNRVFAWRYTLNQVVVPVFESSDAILSMHFLTSSPFGRHLIVGTRTSSLMPYRLNIACISLNPAAATTTHIQQQQQVVSSPIITRQMSTHRSRCAKAVAILKHAHRVARPDDTPAWRFMNDSEVAFTSRWQIEVSTDISVFCVSDDGRWLGFVSDDSKLGYELCVSRFDESQRASPTVVYRARLDDAQHITSLCFTRCNRYVVVTYDVTEMRVAHASLSNGVGAYTRAPRLETRRHSGRRVQIRRTDSIDRTQATAAAASLSRSSSRASNDEPDGVPSRCIVRLHDGCIVSQVLQNDAADGINVARVFPDPALGIVYGTREGRILFDHIGRAASSISKSLLLSPSSAAAATSSYTPLAVFMSSNNASPLLPT